ncbi:MAG: DUF1573 domain-containing protein [Flavobacterium sp.]|nr:DUF1573 domain-containing protein [Flavobacterium sp.]
MYLFEKLFRFVTFSIFVTVYFAITSCKSEKKGIYVISPSILNLTVKRDSTYESKVYVKNQGSNKLNILEVSSSCGCTVGVLKDSILLPFDSVSLDIKFTPNKVDSGEVIRFISLRTNGTPPVKSIEIRAKIISE